MKTCKEISALLSKGAYQRLKPQQWLAVRLHLFICRICRCHQHQIKILGQATIKLLKKKHQQLQLSSIARQRIHQAIHSNSSKS